MLSHPRILKRTLIAISFASIIFSIPVGSAKAFSVGVKSGQWAVYKITGFSPSDPSNVSILIKTVLDPNVTLSISDGYPDGTIRTNNIDFNVLSCDSPKYIRASNLAVGDSICDHTYSAPKIYESITRSFAAGNRTVNIFYTNPSVPGAVCSESLTWVYDKLSGLLVEYNDNYGNCYPTYDLNLTSTNAFSSSHSTFTFQTLSLIALTGLVALSILKRSMRPHFRFNQRVIVHAK